MIINNKVKLKVSKSTVNKLKNKGYKDISINDIIEIDVTDLSLGSHVSVEVRCDICGNEKQLSYIKYKFILFQNNT